MPQHKLHGRWNYFEIPHDGEPREPSPGADMILDIPDENGDVIRDRSSHAQQRVDGTATNRTLDLERGEPGTKRKLKGRVVHEFTVGTEQHIVIAGTFLDEREGVAADSQIEGTWIITKP